MKPLKYDGYAIVLQEVPDEISLAINITGCPHRCSDCHSKHLWEYVGKDLGQDIDNILSSHENFISCICFMGGDQNLQELQALCNRIKMRLYPPKICIYSGLDDVQVFKDFKNIDYLKIGSYKQEYGGLDSEITNQKMYKITDGKYEDITYMFWRKYDQTKH